MLAPGACPVACQQLAPGSALLAGVAGRCRRVPWLSMWTEDDGTVLPPDSARLAGAVNVPLQDVCPARSRALAAARPTRSVTALVLRALGTAPLAAPDPGDCAAARASS